MYCQINGVRSPINCQYAVVSIHPQTLHISHRSFHENHQDAVRALKEEVTDYITNYKKYQTVIYINNKNEMNNHKDTKYFLKVSNKYPNRISIYERSNIINHGYIYNTTKTKIEKIKVFYVVEMNLPNSIETNVIVADDNMNWVNNIQKSTKQANIINGMKVNLVEELKKSLKDRRSKFNLSD